MMHRQQSAPMTAHSLDMAASSSSRRLMSESRMVQSLDFNNAQESRDNDAQIEQERQKCILRQKQTLRVNRDMGAFHKPLVHTLIRLGWSLLG